MGRLKQGNCSSRAVQAKEFVRSHLSGRRSGCGGLLVITAMVGTSQPMLAWAKKDPIFKISRAKGTGSVAQHLPCKREALSSNSSTNGGKKSKSRTLCHICNTSHYFNAFHYYNEIPKRINL
jgi:hypothetical protein